ncbi:MAG: tetratricopeptide repeat protein [Treponema sp.]|nr:tetratricopeptide repeat protein [Treponema sp.]
MKLYKNCSKLFFAVSVLMGFCLCSVMAQTTKRDALLLHNNGREREAIQVCEEELAANPKNIDSYVVMCWALIGNKQYAEAEQRAQEGLAISPYDLRLTESLGEACYYLGKNKAAMEQFQIYVANASESSPRIGSSYYYMGEIFIRQARYQHADIALTTAVTKQPLLDYWWTRLGYAREMAGNYYEALAAYDEALILNSSSFDASRGRERVSANLH